MYFDNWRPAIKDVRGKGGLFSAAFFRTGLRGFFRCGRPHFFVAKSFGFFEIYGVSTRTMGEEG